MKQDFAKRYGPWAVVTGASDGIGRACARELAAQGLNLLLVARRGDVLRAVSDELTQTYRVKCQVLPIDLAQTAERQQLFQAAATLDVGLLVAAAGFGTSGSYLTSDPRAKSEMLAVNCAAVQEQCGHFACRFADRGSGGIVLLSSIVAFQGVPGAAHYAATKAYIQTLVEGLHEELRAVGVDILAAAPGPVRSGFEARADMRMAQALDPDTVTRQTLAALGRGTTVRPGGLSKVLGWSLSTAPRPLRVRIMGKIMHGMTAHQSVAREQSSQGS